MSSLIFTLRARTRSTTGVTSASTTASSSRPSPSSPGPHPRATPARRRHHRRSRQHGHRRDRRPRPRHRRRAVSPASRARPAPARAPPWPAHDGDRRDPRRRGHGRALLHPRGGLPRRLSVGPFPTCRPGTVLRKNPRPAPSSRSRTPTSRGDQGPAPLLHRRADVARHQPRRRHHHRQLRRLDQAPHHHRANVKTSVDTTLSRPSRSATTPTPAPARHHRGRPARRTGHRPRAPEQRRKLRRKAGQEVTPLRLHSRTGCHAGDPHGAGDLSPVGYEKRLMLFSGARTRLGRRSPTSSHRAGPITLKTFSNAVYCRYDESNPRRRRLPHPAHLRQPDTASNANDAIMELMLMIDAAVAPPRTAHRRHPVVRYSRQDKKSRPRPISAAPSPHARGRRRRPRAEMRALRRPSSANFWLTCRRLRRDDTIVELVPSSRSMRRRPFGRPTLARRSLQLPAWSPCQHAVGAAASSMRATARR